MLDALILVGFILLGVAAIIIAAVRTGGDR